jgi:hypothetical protein
MDWPYVKCRIDVEQTISINSEAKPPHVYGKFVLLDTNPLLAKREQVLQHLALERLGFLVKVGDSIKIIVRIIAEMKIKGGNGNTFLYFSSRCDSPAFAIEFPSSYDLGPAEF